jgi:hypothetical protein
LASSMFLVDLRGNVALQSCDVAQWIDLVAPRNSERLG